MPGGGGAANNFMLGQQSGISTAHSVGLNFADSLVRDFYLTGSYFFNLTDNQNPRTVNRQYLLSADSSTLYNEKSDAERKNYNHRLNFRGEYTMDSLNSIILTPQVSFQNNNSSSGLSGAASSSLNTLLSESQNSNRVSTNGYSMGAHAVYRHRFSTPGRTVSLDLGASSNTRESSGDLISSDAYYSGNSVTNDTINQHSGAQTKGYTLSSNIMYTEPLGTTGLIQINYRPSYTRNNSDNKTYDYSRLTDGYTSLNTRLSNVYRNEYVTNSAGIGYRLRGQSFNSTIGFAYQIADLKGEQTFPLAGSIRKKFYSILPNAMLNYELGNRRGLRFSYGTSTSSPSISQLQSVVDNTNPLLLSTGNPDLKQSYTHTATTRLSLANTETANSALVFVFLNYTLDYVGSSTFLAQKDTVMPGGLLLKSGTQLIRPVNLDGNWSFRSFLTYGLPIDLFKSNLNVNGGFSYNRTPGMINSIQNLSNVYTLSPGFVLGSNISTELDFTASYTANFNQVRNSVQSQSDNNYFSQTAGLRFNWIFWQGVVLRSDVINTLYRGLTAGANQNYVLWNVSLGKKFLKDDKGELMLTVYDVLDQNRSISRTVTETYIEDATSRVMQRYFMLTFTYTLREFRPAPDRGPERDHGPGRGMDF